MIIKKIIVVMKIGVILVGVCMISIVFMFVIEVYRLDFDDNFFRVGYDKLYFYGVGYFIYLYYL